MSYNVSILPCAKKELSRLPNEVYTAVKEALLNLSQNPRPFGCKKLTGREGWRIAVGKYRVVYEINDKEKTVTILDIGHRKDIYR